ncbi:unnamed protein product, partial [Rotaria sp. Silwood1]
QCNQIIQKLTLADLDRILYDGKGFYVYLILDYGKFFYCGNHEQISILDKIRLFNQLKHTFYNNLKQGNWLMEYIVNRLTILQNTKQVFSFFF